MVNEALKNKMVERITESVTKRITESVTKELSKSDVVDLVKKDKDIEKAIKKIALDVVTDFFKAIYIHDSMFKNIVRQ